MDQNKEPSKSLKELIKAETNYRFMLQLCFMRPYKPEFKDKGMQMEYLDRKVVLRLTDMEQEIIELRRHAFGNN